MDWSQPQAPASGAKPWERDWSQGAQPPPDPSLTPAGQAVSNAASEIPFVPPPGWLQRGLEGSATLLGDFGAGANRGVAAMLGAPADLANVSPMLLNLLPGEQGMT